MPNKRTKLQQFFGAFEKHFADGDLAGADAIFQQLLPLVQNDWDLVLDWLVAQRQSRQADDVYKAFATRLLAEFPDSIELNCEHGWLLHESGSHKLAAESFGRSLLFDSAHVGALQGRIASLRLLRRFSAAEAVWDMAKSIHDKQFLGILCEGVWIATEQSDFAKAAERLEDVLDHPGAGEDHFLWQLFALRNLKRHEDAQSLLGRAITLFGNTIRLKTEAGWLLASWRDYQQAVRQFAAILEEEPQHVSALQGRVAALRMMGALDDAEHVLATVDPAFRSDQGLLSERAWIAFERQDLRTAEAIFREKVAANPSNMPDKVNLAWMIVNGEDDRRLPEAATLCRKALDLFRSPEALGCLGVISFRQKKFDDAERYFRQSIELDPQRGHHADLGALYTFLSAQDDAERVFLEGIEIKPYDVGLQVEISNHYRIVQQPDKALNAARRAARLAPNKPAVVTSLTLALSAAGKGLEAVATARSALKWAEGNVRVSILLLLARVLIRRFEETKDHDLLTQAQHEVRATRLIRPATAESFFLEGIISREQGRYAAAKSAFRRCCELDPSWTQAEINHSLVAMVITDERRHFRNPEFKSWLIFSIIFVQFIALWIARLYEVRTGTKVLDETAMAVLLPVLLGLMIVALVLPYLTKFSLSGLAVEMESVKMVEAKGPTGKIDFEMATQTMGRSSV